MLRGFRWQLLALIISIAVFVVAILTRPNGADTVLVATQPPTLPATLAPTTATAITTEAAPPSATPMAVDIEDVPVIAPVTQNDNIPTYSEGLVGQMQRLNPLLAGLNPVDRDITSLIFEGLTTINRYGEVVPNLATAWVVSFDGLEYVFTLRENVLWHDGTRFTAADVVYTMSLLSDPAFPGPADLGAFWRTVETQQINDFQVRFRISQPLASFPEALRIGILPYHALQGTSAAQLAEHRFNITPIGTGPYQLEAIREVDGKPQVIDLRVSPNFRQRPEGQSGYALERMRFHLYDSAEQAITALGDGEIIAYAARDWDERAPLLNMTAAYVPHTSFEPSVGFLMFNWGDDDFQVFREERVRSALLIGLDREETVDRYLANFAVPADSPLIPLSWAHRDDLNFPAYDPNQANIELSIANIRTPTPPEGQPTPSELFSFSILTPDVPALMVLAEDIAAQWSALGALEQNDDPNAEPTVARNIVVSVESVDTATYLQRVQTGDFQAAIIELSTTPSADPDVYAFWHQGQYPDGKNYGGVNSRQISEALERARRDPNGINRAIHYADFQRGFIERVIAIPLYYPLYTYSVSGDVRGVQLGFLSSPVDRFATIQNWRFAG